MAKNIARARELRQSQTDAEALIWRRLRGRRFANFKFRRQVPIGNYIVDFVCFDRRLIIELDGGQHNDPSHKDYDAQRDAWLISQEFRIVRYWNHIVLADTGVIEEAIWRELHADILLRESDTRKQE